MNFKFLSAFSAGALLLLCGCVTTHEHVVQLSGDIMVDGPMMITNGPAKDRILWEYRTVPGLHAPWRFSGFQAMAR